MFAMPVEFKYPINKTSTEMKITAENYDGKKDVKNSLDYRNSKKY